MAGDQSESAGSRDFEPTNGEIAPLKKITKKNNQKYCSNNSAQSADADVTASSIHARTTRRTEKSKNGAKFFFFPPKNVKPFFFVLFFSGEALQKKKIIFKK